MARDPVGSPVRGPVGTPDAWSEERQRLRTVGATPAGGSPGIDRLVWERVMRRLHVTARLLAAVLLALAARMILGGPSLVIDLMTAVTAAILLASLLLIRHGRGLEPPERT